MVALKQLSSEYGRNDVRAQQILETLATVRSCLIMLDIEIDAMIVEMFQLFLNTIRLVCKKESLFGWDIRKFKSG